MAGHSRGKTVMLVGGGDAQFLDASGLPLVLIKMKKKNRLGDC